jgi:hypothetical protein
MDLPDCRNIGRRERCLGFATMAALIVLAFGQLRTGAQAPGPLVPVPATGPVDVVASYGADPTWGKNPRAIDSADRIQKAIDENPGRVLYLSPGSYYCSHELTIRRKLTLTGDAVGTWQLTNPSTTLAFGLGSRGIVILDDPKTGGAQETRICYFRLWGLYQNSPLPSKYFVPGEDGITPVFIGPPADGIDDQAGAQFDHLRVDGFRRHGIYIHAGVPANAANLWRIDTCQVDTNGLDVPDDGIDWGDGLHVAGGDANGGIAIALSCTANKGWGIYDRSGLGNAYLVPHTRTNGKYGTTQGGAYRIGAGGPGQSGVNTTGLIVPYQEGDQPTSYLGYQTTTVGGTIAGGFEGGQRIVAGNSSMRFQSGGGTIPPIVAMGNRNLRGPVIAMANWAGAYTVAVTQDGSMGLGVVPDPITPAQPKPLPPKLEVWIHHDPARDVQPAVRYSMDKVGYNAPVGDVVVDADGPGYGSGYVVHRTVGPGGVLSDAIRLQRGRVTVGQGGLQLPALTKAERARLAPPPKAGMVVWGADESALVVYDGTQWKPLTAGR